MNIIEAAKQLQRGYKVRRKFWDDLYLQGEIIPIVYSPDFKDPLTDEIGKSCFLTMDEYLADDWEVVE